MLVLQSSDAVDASLGTHTHTFTHTTPSICMGFDVSAGVKKTTCGSYFGRIEPPLGFHGSKLEPLYDPFSFLPTNIAPHFFTITVKNCHLNKLTARLHSFWLH